MRICLLVALVAGCDVSRPTFKCADWEDCGPGGACEPGTESCSFADASCTKTGRRFSSIAPEPHRDTCVPYAVDAPAAALCDPQMPTCGAYRACLGGRCVATVDIKAGKLLHCARCAFAPNAYGPIDCWGESLVLPPFEPVRLPLPGQFCAMGIFCPPECAMCPGNEGDPTKCPLSCAGGLATADLTVGENHICIFSGRTYCYGLDDQKQIGFGDTVLVQGAITSARLNAVVDHLAAGAKHTCGRGASSRVMCWGNNDYGQLDMTNGPSAPSEMPIGNGPFEPLGTQIGVDFVGASTEFTCAASNDAIRCWGNVPWGAGFVEGLPPGQITDFDVGLHHACAVKGKRVVCWGNNRQGQASPAMPSMLVGPTIVLPTEAIRVVTGRAHTCAIDKAGAIWCWGESAEDQLGGALGPGPIKVRSDPPAVGPMSAGADVTCAVHADDRVRCFGDILQTEGRAYDDFELCQTSRPDQ